MFPPSPPSSVTILTILSQVDGLAPSLLDSCSVITFVNPATSQISGSVTVFPPSSRSLTRIDSGHPALGRSLSACGSATGLVE